MFSNSPLGPNSARQPWPAAPQSPNVQRVPLPANARFYAATSSDLIADINAANKCNGANTIILTAPTRSRYGLTAVNNTDNNIANQPMNIYGVYILLT